MGLDVYLTHYKDFEKSIALEKEYEEKSEALWKADGRNYDERTQEEKDTIHKKTEELAESLGLGEFGEDETYKEDIRIPSKKYPDHMFQIGYMRSSYNNSGMNHILENMGLPTLYGIFGVTWDQPSPITINWEQVLITVKDVIKKFEHKMQTAEGKFRVFNVRANNLFNPEYGVCNAKEALDVFKKELQTTCDFDDYENRDGLFLKDGIKVRGFIRGFDALGQSVVYVVAEREQEDDTLKWYLEALEIIQEMVEYVLAQKDPHNYKLYWSA